MAPEEQELNSLEESGSVLGNKKLCNHHKQLKSTFKTSYLFTQIKISQMLYMTIFIISMNCDVYVCECVSMCMHVCMGVGRYI